jgi:pimeloyl-ACP methyl ester carboxylesterase
MIDALIIEDAPLWLRRHSVEDGSPRAYDFFKSLHELMLITRDENGLREQLPAALSLREDDSLPSRLSQMDPNVLKMSFDNSLMDGFDIDQALRTITCPTLILQAGNQDDASLGDPDVQVASNTLRQSTHYTIEHAGHHIHADQPTRMTTIAKEWLSTHIPA